MHMRTHSHFVAAYRNFEAPLYGSSMPSLGQGVALGALLLLLASPPSMGSSADNFHKLCTKETVLLDCGELGCGERYSCECCQVLGEPWRAVLKEQMAIFVFV